MKKETILIFIFFIFLSCRIPDKQINISIENHSGSDLLISNIKDTLSINKLLKENNFQNKMDNNLINIVTNKTKSKIDFSSYELDFYFSGNQQFYVFYFVKINQINRKMNFKNQCDSLIIKVDDLKIGKSENNNLIYSKDKLTFANPDCSGMTK